MGIMRPENDKMKLIVMAVGGAIIAAVGTMFVPASLLESITGATGLSELVPATAAPLGDTARALIAFGAGAVTLIVLLAFAMRQSDNSDPRENTAPSKTESYGQTDDNADRFSGLKERMAQLRLPKMPWARGEGDILDLADLPKLRSNDAHPDAPPRRPISVLNDIEDSAAIQPEEPMAPVADFVAEQSDREYTEPGYEASISAPAFQSATPVYEAPVAAHYPNASQPSLADMVAQMEAAVEQRKQQLQALEVVAAEMMAGTNNTSPSVAKPTASTASDPTPVSEDYTSERPPLEAVPSVPHAEDDDDMDAALNAALETLQRMNRAGS